MANDNKRKPPQAAQTETTALMGASAQAEVQQGPGAAQGDPGEALDQIDQGPAQGGPAPMDAKGAAPWPDQMGSDISHIASAEHALPVLRSKITRLHQLVHNVGEIALAPVREIEALMADVQYLVGIIRSKI